MSIEHRVAATSAIHPVAGLGPYANESARLAEASPIVGMIGQQTDTGAFWIVAVASPLRWRLNAGPVPVRTNVGTTYTLVLADADGMVDNTNAGTITFTVPLNVTVPFVIGDIVLVRAGGAGTVTIAPFSGAVTIQSKGALVASSGQYAVLCLIYMGSDKWALTGDRA